MSLNAEAWSPIEVADWIAGLDPTCGDGDPSSHFATYSASFLSAGVTGRLLLNLMGGDLQKYGIERVGDQLLVQEAIQFLRYELDTPRITLQSLASSLGVRCRNYRTELSSLQKGNHIPTESLGSASFLLDASKILIRWLTRPPFVGQGEYDGITINLTKHCFELAMLSQRDSFADNAIEEVQYLCTKIIEICERLVTESKDSLVIQPAAVDVITLRKRTEQELGLHVESSYFGLHQVSGVRLSSPAQQSGHLEKGDEILQINYQTVIGWPQNNVINLLTENANEVVLTVKRRPRHATANILGQMYLRPSNKLTTHRSQKRHRDGAKGAPHLMPSSLTLPTRRHQKSIPISPVPEDENSSSSTSSSSGTTPVVVMSVSKEDEKGTDEGRSSQDFPAAVALVHVPVTATASGGATSSDNDNSSSTPQLTTGQSLDTLDSDDMMSVIGQSPSRAAEEVDKVISKANNSVAASKFWKLYPRPRNLIRRRATVTGASPTSTRPPVTFFDDEGSTSKAPFRPPLMNSKSAPDKIRIGLRKQGHVEHRQTMPPNVDFDITNIKATSSYESERLALLNKKDEQECSPAPNPISVIGIAEALEKDEKTPMSISPIAPKQKHLGNENEAKDTIFSPTSEVGEEELYNKDENEVVNEDSGSVIFKGVLHLRQSPANLLVKSNSLTSTLTGTGFSPHPRWTRHPATLYSNQILQIGSDPQACLRIPLAEHCHISLAKEVHSRPFAFKIEKKGGKGIYYLAAECQQEFETWMRQLLPPDACDSIFRPIQKSAGLRDLIYQKLRNPAPPAYKRSISLGNSPAYTRRSSLRGDSASPSGSSVTINTHQDSSFIYQNRSFILRRNNLLRSSRLVGNSTPNVLGSSVISTSSALPSRSQPHSYTPSTYKPAVPPKRTVSETVKSEWFKSPSPKSPTTADVSTSTSTPIAAPRTRVLCSTPTAQPYRSQPVRSNISSITIRSLVRKSETSSTSPEKSPTVSAMSSPTRSCKSRPSMGISIVLAKNGGQSPLSSPVKKPVVNTPVELPKDRNNSSSSSSSDVFVKGDLDIPDVPSKQPVTTPSSCPSCGGSTSSFSKSDKNAPTREIWTQTEQSSSPSLELLRHLINEEEGSRV